MRRRPLALTLATLATVAALTACGDSGDSVKKATDPATNTSSGSCEWTTDPNGAAKEAKPPAGDTKPTATRATMETSEGTIAFSLDRATAPCTTLSFESLAAQKYFDDTSCHRLTVSPGLLVLQCGDPSGSGMGGPGYTIPDELDAAEALADSPSGVKNYAAGTVAMANTGSPNSGGSQFFLVYEDSELPPTYTVFGKMDEASTDVVRSIAKGGLAADGTAPATEVKISSFTTS